MEYIFLIICFLASLAGAICGIGGGIIIKPALDMLGMADPALTSFLSGCTVLAMSCYSVIRNSLSAKERINFRIGTPLAIGSILGGAAGKLFFSYLSGLFEKTNGIAIVQASCLVIILVATLIFTLLKAKVKPLKITNIAVCLAIGLLLGVISSFLGIGGGPFNLAVLFYFFSMNTKTAARNSLYIIMLSQTANLITAGVTHSIPTFDIFTLVLMILGGLLGGVVGRLCYKKMSGRTIEKIFILIMVLVILISAFNVYNAYQNVFSLSLGGNLKI